MKTLIFIAAFLFSTACFGQTKLISFRSHSGSNANFRTAVENNLFDIGNSNFGIVSNYDIDKIDTVMLKGSNEIIVLRLNHHISYVKKNDKKTFMRDTLTRANAPGFFAAGNIDDLKAELRKKYRAAAFDSVYYIGFDKKFKQKKNQPKK